MDETDLNLLERFAAGDEGAFAELVRRHETMVRGACRRILADPADSDDATQATFLALAAHADRLRGRGRGDSVAGWLHRVAVNRARQSKRQAATRRRHEAGFAKIQQTHESAVESAEAMHVLDEELNALPARFRAPLVLCHLKGKTQRQAAQELGLTYATLRRRLDSAKQQMQHRLLRRGIAVLAGLAAALWKPVPALAGRLTAWRARLTPAEAAAGFRAAAALVVVIPCAWAAAHLAGRSPAPAAHPVPVVPIEVAAAAQRLTASEENRTRDNDGAEAEIAATRKDDSPVDAQAPTQPPASEPSDAGEPWAELLQPEALQPESPRGAAETSVENNHAADAQPAADAQAQIAPAERPRTDQPATRQRVQEPAAGPRRTTTIRASEGTLKKKPAKPVRSKAGKLYGIAWHPSVASALRAAQGVVSDQRGKPVFCLRVLGNLSGFM